MSGSNKRYPLDRPPGGMVVEPELPEEDNNMGPNQVSENNATAVASDDAIPLDDIPAATDESIEAPTEVRQAVASMPATGVHFNYEPFKQIAALNQAGRRDEAIAMRDKLDPQSRYVYDNIKNMKRVPASEAARLADEWRQKQDQSSTPQAQYTQMRIDEKMDKSKDDAQKTYQRASNMLFLLDNLRGGGRDQFADQPKDGQKPKGSEDWRTRVGAFDGRWPSLLSSEKTLGWNADFASLKGMINLDEAVRNAGQGSLSDGERALMAQAASLGLEQLRDEPGFEKAFERMYDLALETQKKAKQKLSGSNDAEAPSTSGAQQAPQQTKKIGNQTWVKTQNGWIPKR